MIFYFIWLYQVLLVAHRISVTVYGLPRYGVWTHWLWPMGSALVACGLSSCDVQSQ